MVSDLQLESLPLRGKHQYSSTDEEIRNKMPARPNSPIAKFMASVTEETFQVLLGEAKP
jgi:hypothetical protein